MVHSAVGAIAEMPFPDAGVRIAQVRIGIESLGNRKFGIWQTSTIVVGQVGNAGAKAIAAGQHGSPGGRTEGVRPDVSKNHATLAQRLDIRSRGESAGISVAGGRVRPQVIGDDDQDIPTSLYRRRRVVITEVIALAPQAILRGIFAATGEGGRRRSPPKKQVVEIVDGITQVQATAVICIS